MRLTTRERTPVQKAVLDCARKEFARWEVRGDYKNPEALLMSLRKRLQRRLGA